MVAERSSVRVSYRKTVLTLSAVSELRPQPDGRIADLVRLLELYELAADSPLREVYADRLIDAVWGDAA